MNAVRKEINNPSTKNINKNTVAVLNSVKCAFLPYDKLSERQLGESAVRLIKNMLFGAVRALTATEVYLKMKGSKSPMCILLRIVYLLTDDLCLPSRI